jgi:hypothetical protein
LTSKDVDKERVFLSTTAVLLCGALKNAMVADAGDVPRPPPLLLRPLHWPMPPLALPPLESHGG